MLLRLKRQLQALSVISLAFLAAAFGASTYYTFHLPPSYERIGGSYYIAVAGLIFSLSYVALQILEVVFAFMASKKPGMIYPARVFSWILGCLGCLHLLSNLADVLFWRWLPVDLMGDPARLVSAANFTAFGLFSILMCIWANRIAHRLTVMKHMNAQCDFRPILQAYPTYTEQR